MKVEFYRHNVDEDDIARVGEVLRNPFLTTGKVTKEFEEKQAAYLGVPHCVGLSSCTAALHLSLLALGVGPGDEVITTPMTFIASSNAVLYVGAKPVFVDVEPSTGLIDPARAEAAITPRTKAIIVVHLYGQMCDMKAFRALADRRNLKLIEDCAHAIESTRDGARPGQLGDAACFSYYATKNITSGEGGAVATRHGDIADRIRVLRQHGMSASAADRYTSAYRHWDMETLGWKCNLTNIQAAMLLGQLARIEELVARREAICRQYEAAFSGVPGLDFPKVLPGCRSARHLFTIWVAPERRDAVLAGLQERGIGVAVNFRAVHLLSYYRKTFGFERGAFPIAEKIGDSTITLPLYVKLTQPEIDWVIESVKETVRR